MRHIPANSPDVPALVEGAVNGFDGHPDLLVLARGGTIEAGSVWDSIELLRCVNAIQRLGIPVMAAVGHAAYTPLVYDVAAHTAEHPTVAARMIRDHNAGTARRVDAAAQVSELLSRRVSETRQHVQSLTDASHALLLRHAEDRGVRLRLAQESLHRGIERQLELTERRCLAAARTLGGFENGLALVSALDGGRTEMSVGERIVVRSAARTVVARVEETIVEAEPVDGGAK